MADVSVEFGAQDVGLEKALQQIQTEMGNLQGKVKSGELSMEELEQTMRRIGQVENMEKRLKAMGDQSGAASPKVDALGKDIKGAGEKSEKMGDQAGIGFGKLAAAVGVGQAAFEAFKGAATLGLSAVTGAIGSLVNSFTSAIDAAADMETLETAFIPLLGSAEAAQKRIEELAKFAAETPFEMPEIAKASKTLETLTRGALSTADGLRLVGDVASATNTPFEEISTTVGRLYDGLQSGRPVGEVMQRLQELGVVSGDTRSQIEALSKEGKNTEAWLVAEEALNRFSGSMKLQSGTWKGLLSTLGDNITQSLAKFGQPILDSLKPYLQGTIKFVEMLSEKAAAFGKHFAENFIASSESVKLFQKAIEAIGTGQLEAGFNLFWETLKLQAMETGNAIYKYLTASLQTTADAIVGLFGPSSGTFTLIIDSFAYAGKAAGVKFAQGILALLPDINDGLLKSINLAATFLPNIAGPAALAFNAANKGLDALRGSMDGMQANLEKQKETLGTSFDNFSANAKKQIGEIPKEFEQNLASANAEFFKTEEQAAKVAEAEKAITTATGETNAERANGAANLQVTGTTLEKIAQTEELLKQAIADGNTELQTRLEKNLKVLQSQAEGEAAAARAKALSLEIVELETALNEAKALGNEELAKSLEKQLEQKKANEEIAKLTTEYQKTLGVTKTEAGILAENFVNAKNAAAAVQVDKTTVADAKKEAEKAAEAAKSFATWLDYIRGVDPSAPVKSLKEQAADARKEINAFGEYIGVDLKNKSYPDVARELGIKNLGATGTEQMNQILDHIKSKRGELTGIQPIDEKGGQAALATLTSKIASLGTSPQTLNLDASKSIEGIKSKLKENIDLAITTGEGSKILGEIRGFVETIKGLVEKIEPKLPVSALTA